MRVIAITYPKGIDNKSVPVPYAMDPIEITPLAFTERAASAKLMMRRMDIVSSSITFLDIEFSTHSAPLP